MRFLFNIFGPSVADNAVMMGKNYIQSRLAMRNLSEAVSRIRLDKFKEHCRMEIFEPLEPLVADVCSKHCDPIQQVSWNAIGYYILEKQFIEQFETFKKAVEETSEIWRYWNLYLDFIITIIINLHCSFREAD